MLIPSCCYYCFEGNKNTAKSSSNLRKDENDNNVFENLMKKYPDIFQFCCLCLTRKRKTIGCAEKLSNGQTNEGNGETTNENGTPIIPITIPPDMYVVFCI
jgi:hypothetical protein